MVMPLQSKPPARGHAAPHHARAVAPEMGHAVDSKGNRFKFGPHNPATVGPDTILILHGRPPQRAHQHYAQHGGTLPPEVMKHAANQHPGTIVQQLANAAHKELPTHNQKSKGALPMGGMV
jgi:hypothetical protein